MKLKFVLRKSLYFVLKFYSTYVFDIVLMYRIIGPSKSNNQNTE